MSATFSRDLQYYRFCLYGFFKNLRFFEAFLLLYFLEQGLTYLAIGTLYAIREITINIFEVPSGVIADAMGRRRTMILAFLFYIGSFVVFFLAGSYAYILLAMILFSFGEAFRSGNNKAMIFHYLSLNGWADQKVHYYGHTRSWSQMGSAFSALSGAAIVFFSGSYRYIFLFSVIPYVLDLLLVASYPKVLDGELRRFSWTDISDSFRNVFRALFVALRSLLVIRIIGSLSLFSGYYKAMKDYLQAVVAAWAFIIPLMTGLDHEQRSSVMIGMVFFIVYLLSSMASRSSGRFSERFLTLSAPLNLTLALGLAFGLLSGLFYVAGIWVVAVVFFVLVYMVENIRKPVGVAYLGSSIESSALASVLSVDSQMQSVTAAILAPIFGIFADLYGVGWSIVMVSAGLVLLSPLLIITRKNG